MANSNHKRTKRNPRGGTPTNKPDDQLNNYKHICSKGNDPAWYNMNPELVKNAASIPFSTMTGRSYSISGYSVSSTVGSNLPNRDIPNNGIFKTGICRINYVPTYGTARNINDPLNIAAQREYSWVRHMNSGSKNYEKSDLMLYFICLDSAISYHAWLTRLYGILNTYTPENLYMPRAIVESMDLDFDELLANQMQLLSHINQFAAKLSQFTMPTGFPIVLRHMYMCSNIYRDHETNKSQLYYFNPTGFYVFNPVKYNTGGCAEYKAFAPYNLEDLITYGNDMINQLQYVEDIGIMSGDILKAYGEGSVLKYSSIETGFSINPIYDEALLTQIHNMQTAGNAFSGKVTSHVNAELEVNAQDIYQNGGFIYHNPYFYKTDYPENEEGVELGMLIDTPNLQPDPLEVMYATRLSIVANTHAVTEPASDMSVGSISGYASEIPTGVTIFYFHDLGNGKELTRTSFNTRTALNTTDSISVTNLWSVLTRINVLSEFNWSPMYSVGQVLTNGTFVPVTQVWESKHSTVVSPETMDNIHNVATLSLFNITHNFR